MTAAPYHRKMARVLDRLGGLYTLNDILSRIAEGKMQSFVVNNSWAITEVQDFPRVRQVMIVALVGDLADIDALQAKIFDYAAEIGAGLVSAHGRMGWTPHAKARGWRVKTTNYLFHKDM